MAPELPVRRLNYNFYLFHLKTATTKKRRAFSTFDQRRKEFLAAWHFSAVVVGVK